MSRLLLALLLAGSASARTLPAISVNQTPPDRQSPMPSSFSSIVQAVGPAVVSVTTRQKQRHPGREQPQLEDPLFRHFFGPGLEPMPLPPALGSGVIVSPDGYVLTNYHVVEDAAQVTVTLADHAADFPAKIIGVDPKTDIAVLKVAAKRPLPTVTFADSSKASIGDVCLAIGNPFGLGQTVTMGIISAVGRGIGIEDYEDFIQTDAAINPGNSGGPLVDAQGRLIGINTAILSRTGGNQGIGFAVPSNLARSIMVSLITKGKVVRGYLGAAIQDVTPELARQFRLRNTQGALVGQVMPHTGASRAGLKSGDVIVRYQGKVVTNSRHMRLEVAATPPGTRVALGVVRGGKQLTLTATLSELPQEEKSGPSQEERQGGFLSGVELQDLTDDLRVQLDAPKDLHGAVVASVLPGSDAYMAGLRVADVIQEVNHTPVNNAQEAVAAARSARGHDILLRVWSQGASRYMVVPGSKGAPR